MTSTRSILWTAVEFAVMFGGAAAAGVFGAGRCVESPPELHTQNFRLERSADQPLEVTPDRFLDVPFWFGDFDLFADLELPEDGEVDLVFRSVEPRLREGVMPRFHGRFAALRLSTRAAGDAVRSRERALFGGEADRDGQLLAAGVRATVVLEARGRSVRANVAGVGHPEFRTTDAHGSLAFVARGGTAVIHSLDVFRVDRPTAIPPIAWGAALGIVLGAWLATRRVRRSRAFVAALCVPAVGVLGATLVLGRLVGGCEPEPLAILACGVAGLPLAAIFAVRIRVATTIAGVLLVFGGLEIAARVERDRLAALEDPRLDAWFGPDSGSAPFDALAGRLRARSAVYVPRPADTRVVFLGGLDVFEPADRDRWLAPYAVARASQTAGRAVEGVTMSTIEPSCAQQLALFERFYAAAFSPRVVVFAVPRSEAEPRRGWSTHAVLDGQVHAPGAGPSVLLDAWRADRRRRSPRTDAPDLRRTLDELAALARRSGFDVVVADSAALPSELRAVVDDFVTESGSVRARGVVDSDSDARVARLADAITAALRR